MVGYANSEKTRKALIDAAGELVAEKGFDNVTTRAIAEKAGENIGSLHYHFGSKNELFQAVLEEATKTVRNNSFETLLENYPSILETPLGQARALRIVVHSKIVSLFQSDYPRWYCRVVFQVYRGKGPMREWLFKKILRPWLETVEAIFHSISPDLSKEELFSHAFLLVTPLVFHVNYMEAVLAYAGKSELSHEYFQMLEDILVRQVQCYFALPDDRQVDDDSEGGKKDEQRNG